MTAIVTFKNNLTKMQGQSLPKRKKVHRQVVAKQESREDIPQH